MKNYLISISFLLLSFSFVYAQVLEIPFELKNDIILIEVAVNDNAKARTFVFDTGATSDVLDKAVAEELGLKPNYQQKVPGAGGIETYDIVLGQTLVLQNTINIANSNLVLVDLQRLRTKIERDFDGIIGYSLIKNFVTKIDYDNNKILLFNRIEEVATNNFKAVPFQFHNGITIPQFDVSITLRNGDTFTDRVLFDSGAALTLIVNTPYNKKNDISRKAGKRLITEFENLSTKSISEEIAIESLNIAGYNLNEMVISIANDKAGVSSYKGYLGILGAKVISRFNVILDYSASTLYLKPNNRYNKKFEFPLSGLTLKKENSTIVISRVQEDSPAYKKGIRKGDQLLSINGNKSSDIETFRNLLKEEGKTCQLLLLNSQDKVIKIELTLNRLL